MTSRLALLKLFVPTAVAAGTCVALATHVPSFSGSAKSWTGEQLMLAAAWAVATACAAWIAVTGLLALVALVLPSADRASFVARVGAPRFMRRIVEASVAGSLVAGAVLPGSVAFSVPVPVASVAAPAVAPPGDQPVVRGPSATPLVAPPGDQPVARGPSTTPLIAPPGDQPVVRTPSTVPAATTPPPPSPAPTPPSSGTATAPSRPPTVTPPATNVERVHTVVPGDNLWRIARAALIARGDPSPDPATIDRYWRAVIERNRASLRSRDPNLIFPGEVVALPDPG